MAARISMSGATDATAPVAGHAAQMDAVYAFQRHIYDLTRKYYLLGRDRLWAPGVVVVARPADRRGYPAESARRRGELAAAAERGGFAPGEAVHLPARRLDPAAIESGADADPIGLDAGRAVVRWTRGAPPMPLAAYLDERIGLLLHPPERA